MKISISAVGRLRNSPEKELIDDYLSRFSKLSKPFGLSLNPFEDFFYSFLQIIKMKILELALAKWVDGNDFFVSPFFPILFLK